jgi:hypothetical protein
MKALNTWIKFLSPINMFFLVLSFYNLVILVGKKLEKCGNSNKNVNNKNFEITNLKGKKGYSQ